MIIDLLYWFNTNVGYIVEIFLVTTCHLIYFPTDKSYYRNGYNRASTIFVVLTIILNIEGKPFLFE